MATVTIRQSGGAEIVSIPKAIGKALGLQVGSKLDLSIEDNKVVLNPIGAETTLEALLAESPRENFRVIGEDRQWIDATPVGKET